MNSLRLTENRVAKWSVMLLTLTAIASCSAPPTPEESISSDSASQTILIDGSSTVFPLTQEVIGEMQFELEEEAPSAQVEFSGTGGGFQKFCAGETDINDASRPISQEEMELCRSNNIEYIELPVAFDALTVVVHPDNDWADSITLDELRTIWEPSAEGEIMTWSQVRSGWPDEPLNLHGADVESGTYDYFAEAVVGDAGETRSDYTDQVDDEDIVRAVRGDSNALGYFGYAYYEANERTLKALAIDSGNGPVEPSTETVSDGSYAPFARPLFIYVNADAAELKPELQAFVNYYLSNAQFLARVVGYIPLSTEAYNLASEHFENKRIGTVFDGKLQTGLTLEELLQKDASF